MRSIIRKELKLLLKGKGNFFFLLAMPILFIALFGSVFSGASKTKFTVNYVDQDKTAISQSFLSAIGKVNGFTLKSNATSLSDQIQQIKDGKMTSLIVIPAGFGQQVGLAHSQAPLKFYRDATDDSVTGPIESVVQSIANQYDKQHIAAALAATGKSQSQVQQLLQPSILVQEIKEVPSGSSFSMLDQVVPGYTVMFVFFIIMSMTRSFIGEKESGMLARLRSTPMSPMTYLLGMWIPSLVAVLIQSIVLLGFGHFVYGVNLGDLSAMAIIVLCLGICGTGIGLAVSLLARGENQGRSITMLISLGGAAVGGVWFPTQFMPNFMQVIGHFTPQYWAQKGFQDVMIRGAHIAGVWPSILALLAFGAAGYFVALLRFGGFMRSATN